MTSPPDREELRRQVNTRVAQEEATYGTGAPEPGKEEAAPASVFAKIDWRDHTAGRLLDAPFPELAWVFVGFLLTRCVALLAGQPGTGKSMLALLLAFLVACGRGLDGLFEPGGLRGRALVLAGEEDERIIPRRVRAIRNHLFPDGGGKQDFNRDADEHALRENLIVIPLAGQSLRLLDKDGPGAPFTTAVYEELTVLCKGIDNLQLIVIDPQSRFYGLDENDNSASTVYIEVLERLANETGASILCLHHVGKGAKSWEDNLHQYAARGASGFVGAVRAQLNLVTLTKEEVKKVIRPDEEPDNGEYLALGFAKCSYGPPRPPVFLRRLQGGVFEPIEPNGRTAEEAQTEAAIFKWIVAKIKDQAENDLPDLTIPMLKDFSQEWGGIFGATRARVLEVANAAVNNGELFLVPGKNKMGRMVALLRLEPEKTPAKTPAEKTPAKPAKPAEQARLVCNELKQKDNSEEKTPAEETPADDLASIENPRQMDISTPAIPASLKRESAAGLAGPHLSSESVEGGVNE